MSGLKIKICGLTRRDDVDYVNSAVPDYVGFVFYDKSRRCVSEETACELSRHLKPDIVPVGVFVNDALERICRIYKSGAIKIVQLHGNEDGEYIERLRKELPGTEIWKAFRVKDKADMSAARACPADRVVLDSGGGTGKRFDWSLIKDAGRPFILAGGLAPDNIREAAERLRPWAVDLSSGVEAGGLKDAKLIKTAVDAARGR